MIIYFLRSKVIFSKTEKSIIPRKIRKWFKIRTNWVIRGNSFFFKIKPVKIWLHRRQPAPWCPPFFQPSPLNMSTPLPPFLSNSKTSLLIRNICVPLFSTFSGTEVPVPWFTDIYKTSQNIRFIKTYLTLWHDDIALENIVKHTIITQVIKHKLYRVNPIKRNTKLTDLHYISDLNRSGFKIYHKVIY